MIKQIWKKQNEVEVRDKCHHKVEKVATNNFVKDRVNEI